MCIARCKECVHWDNKTEFRLDYSVTPAMDNGRCEVLEKNIRVDISTKPIAQEATVDYMFTPGHFSCGGFEPKISDNLTFEDLTHWNHKLQDLSERMASQIKHTEIPMVHILWEYIGEIGEVRQLILNKINE